MIEFYLLELLELKDGDALKLEFENLRKSGIYSCIIYYLKKLTKAFLIV
jgi:hypothetical protein